MICIRRLQNGSTTIKKIKVYSPNNGLQIIIHETLIQILPVAEKNEETEAV
ncbi:MAG: hypothetical protein ABJA71_04735 [Ginsengibacter sp.]